MPTPECLFCNKQANISLPTTGVCLACYALNFNPVADTYVLKCPGCKGNTNSPINHNHQGTALTETQPEWCTYSHDDDSKSTCQKTGTSTAGLYKKLHNTEAFAALALAFAKIGEAYDLDTRAKLAETEYEVELEYTQDEADRQRVLSYGTYDWRSMAFVARR